MVLGDQRSKKPVVSGYRPDVRALMFSKHGDYIGFLAREWWEGMMHTYRPARICSLAFGVGGDMPCWQFPPLTSLRLFYGTYSPASRAIAAKVQPDGPHCGAAGERSRATKGLLAIVAPSPHRSALPVCFHSASTARPTTQKAPRVARLSVCIHLWILVAGARIGLSRTENEFKSFKPHRSA